MSALRETVPSPITPAPAPVPVHLDEYGRDPAAPSEQLRRLSDYKAQSGYAPFFTSWFADLPRLTSGNVCTLFLMLINNLSLGRPDNTKANRHEWTKPVTVEYLAAVLRCHIRDVQRQIRDLGPADGDGHGRGLIAVKRAARGAYQFSLLYREWRTLPDYQPGPRLVSVDEPEAGDTEAPESAEESVRLCKRPLKVSAGKSGRAVPVPVSVSSLRWQNGCTLPLVYDAVVQGSQLLISTRLAADWRTIAESEQQANESRHTRRNGAGGSAPDLAADPRARDVISIFDPLLERTGERLLIGDAASLSKAVQAMGEMPADFLRGWLKSGKQPRADRPISGPRVVAAIITEAHGNWSAGQKRPAPRRGSSGSGGGAGKSGNSFVDSVTRGMNKRHAIAKDVEQQARPRERERAPKQLKG